MVRNPQHLLMNSATTYLLTKWRMNTTVKTCFKCGAEKAITEFYVHPQMGDGRLNKCKQCTRKDVSKNYQDNLDYYRAYDKKRGFRPSSPEKTVARNAVNRALKMGRIVRGPCEIGTECFGRIEGHHDDYSKPLEVRWLCKKHHAEAHTQQDTVAA